MTAAERILALLADGQPRYGLEIAKQARVRVHSMYPVLARLEADGKIRSEWAPSSRRVYSLAEAG